MFLTIIIDSIRFSTVFLFGSAGETITEKSGHLNLGTPGIMCIGAMGSAIGAYIYLSAIGGAGNANWFMAIFMPLLFCLLFAGAAGALFSFFAVTLRCNQNVTGLAITTLGVGLYPFATSMLDGSVTMGFSTIAHRYITTLFPKAFVESNWLTQLLFSYGILVYLAIAVAITIAIVMKRTRVGLFLRAVGENPSSADAVGISVDKYRYLATIIGSAISGLGGMFYLFDRTSGAFEFVVDAYGWLAVSLVIFTMWNTEIGIGGSFLFAFLYIFPKYLNVSGPDKKLIELVPYLATIVILVLTSIFSKRMGMAPAGLGQSYFREDR
jgi:simple sugar transport system permease protein